MSACDPIVAVPLLLQLACELLIAVDRMVVVALCGLRLGQVQLLQPRGCVRIHGLG